MARPKRPEPWGSHPRPGGVIWPNMRGPVADGLDVRLLVAVGAVALLPPAWPAPAPAGAKLVAGASPFVAVCFAVATRAVGVATGVGLEHGHGRAGVDPVGSPAANGYDGVMGQRDDLQHG